MKDDLLALGKCYNEKINDDSFYKELITDTDFNGRTVLKIICDGQFMPLMDSGDPKAENLINQMWTGEESSNCDGNIYGYSNMTCILFQKGKKATDKTRFHQIVTNHFDTSAIMSDDYTFQFRYRSKDISYYYQKEFIFGAIMVYLLLQVDLAYS